MSPKRRERPILLGLICALCAGHPAPGGTIDEYSRYIPNESAFILAIPDIDRVASAIQQVGEHVGAPALRGMDRSDLLDAFETLGDSEFVKPRGGILVAMHPILGVTTICTLTDVNAWKTKAAPRSETDGVMQLAGGRVAAIRGNTLIVSDEPELLSAALKSDGALAKRFAAAAGERVRTHDAVLFIELEPWRPMIRSALIFGRGMMASGIMAAGPEAQAGIEFWNVIFDALFTVLDETRSYVAAARASGAGVHFIDHLTFTESGRVGDYLGSVRKTDQPLLRGLRDGNYAAVFGVEWSVPPGKFNALTEFSKAMLNADRLRSKIGHEKFEQCLRQMVELHDRLRGYSGTLDFGQAEPGFRGSGLYITDDPVEYLRLMRESVQLSPEFLNAYMTGSVAAIERGTDSIGGVDVDVLKFRFSSDDPQIRSVLETTYGKDSALYLAPHALGAMYAMGPAPEARRNIEALLSAGGAALTDSPRTRAAFEQVAENPQICFLVDIPVCIAAGVNFSRHFGVPAPFVHSPAEPSDFSIYTMYLEKNAIRGELFVPSTAMKRTAEMIDSLNKAKSTSTPEGS